MKKLLQGLLLIVLVMGVTAAFASTVIDFSTGQAGTGGTVTLLSGNNVTGVGIPIGTVTISGAPTNNGVFTVTGSCSGSNATSTGCLAFDTSAGTISVGGAIVDLGISNQTLLSGTIGSFFVSGGSLFILSGSDTKSADLLTALGVATDTSFAPFGSSITTNPISTVGGTSDVTSSDIRNSSVPEPASLMLLGSGLLGLGGLARKKLVR